jgi:hypothetical protein
VTPDDPDKPLYYRHDGWTPYRQAQFLDGLAETASVTAAAGRVGLTTTSAYRLRQKSPMFAQAWAQALERATVDLEAIAFERAVHGVEEPVFHDGKQVGVKRRYSDRLLLALLQARVPERYGRSVGRDGFGRFAAQAPSDPHAASKEIERRLNLLAQGFEGEP